MLAHSSVSFFAFSLAIYNSFLLLAAYGHRLLSIKSSKPFLQSASSSEHSLQTQLAHLSKPMHDLRSQFPWVEFSSSKIS